MNAILNILGTTLAKYFSNNPLLLVGLIVGVWVFLWVYKEVRKGKAHEREQQLERLDKIIEAYANLDFCIGKRLSSNESESNKELNEAIANATPYVEIEIIEMLQKSIESDLEKGLKEGRDKIRIEIKELRGRNESLYPVVSGKNIDKFEQNLWFTIRKFIDPLLISFWVCLVITGGIFLIIVDRSSIPGTEKLEIAITIVGMFFLLLIGGLFVASAMDKQIFKEGRWQYPVILIVTLVLAVYTDGWKLKSFFAIAFIAAFILGAYLIDKKKKILGPRS